MSNVFPVRILWDRRRLSHEFRVFTDGITVLEALKKVFFTPEEDEPMSPTDSNK